MRRKRSLWGCSCCRPTVSKGDGTKTTGKKIGFARIKLEGKQNIILETKMEEPAWKNLHQRLPSHLQSRFVFQAGKAIVRGLGSLSADKQLETLIDYLEKMQGDN